MISFKNFTLVNAFCFNAFLTMAISSLDCFLVMIAGGDGSKTKLNPFCLIDGVYGECVEGL